jgi:hypothetical protein
VVVGASLPGRWQVPARRFHSGSGRFTALRLLASPVKLATWRHSFSAVPTRTNVQGIWTSEDAPEHGYTYLPVQCTACLQLHFLNPLTGKVLGSDDDDEVDDDF